MLDLQILQQTVHSRTDFYLLNAKSYLLAKFYLLNTKSYLLANFYLLNTKSYVHKRWNGIARTRLAPGEDSGRWGKDGNDTEIPQDGSNPRGKS